MGNDLLDAVDAGVLDADEAPDTGPGFGVPPGGDRRRRMVQDNDFSRVRARPSPGAKSLSEYWLKYGPEHDPNFSVNVHRIKSYVNGQPVGGYLESTVHQITEPEIKSRWGGGRFKIEIYGSDPKTNAPGHKYEEILVEIEGAPKFGQEESGDGKKKHDDDDDDDDRRIPPWRRNLGSLADDVAPRRPLFGSPFSRPAYTPPVNRNNDNSGDAAKVAMEMLRDVIVARESKSPMPMQQDDSMSRLKELLGIVQAGKGPEAHHVVQELATRHQAQIEALAAKHAAEIEEIRNRAARDVERVESRYASLMEDEKRSRQDIESKSERSMSDIRREYDRKVDDLQREIDRLRGMSDTIRNEKVEELRRADERHKSEIDRLREDFRRELEMSRRVQEDALKLERERNKDVIDRLTGQNQMYIDTLKSSHEAMSTAERTGQQSIMKVLEGDVRGLESENRRLRDTIAELEKRVASGTDVHSQVKGLLSLKDALGALGIGRAESEAIIAAPTDAGAWGKVQGLLDSKFGEAAGAILAQAAANVIQQQAGGTPLPGMAPPGAQQVQQPRPAQQPRPVQQPQQPRPQQPRPAPRAATPPQPQQPRPVAPTPPKPQPVETDFLIPDNGVKFDLPPDGAPVIAQNVVSAQVAPNDPIAGVVAFVKGIEGAIQMNIPPSVVADDLRKNVPPDILAELRDGDITTVVAQITSFVPSQILVSDQGIAYMAAIQQALRQS